MANSGQASLSPNQAGGQLNVVMVAFVAAVGGFLFGYDLVIIMGAQLFVRDYFHLPEGSVAHAWALSSANIGCICGPFLGMWLCDAVGRKRTLIGAAILFAVSAVMTALPNDILTFNVFRAVGGLGVGLASVASPMYIVEVAPARLRGRLGLMFQLAVCVGAFIAAIVGYCLSKYVAEDVSWRWMFGSEIVPIVFFVAALWTIPFSPRWLAEKGRHEEALAVLSRIDGAEQAKREMEEIKRSLQAEPGTFGELFQPGIRMALLVGILLAAFNNWTGWTAIAYYSGTLFQKAGFMEKSDAILQAAFIFGANIFLTMIALWLVDRVGRRVLWNVTAFAMIFATLLGGLVFQLNMGGTIAVIVVFLVAVPHAIGLGGLPWLMMSELFPTRIRAKAVAITSTVIWIGSWSASMSFPLIVKKSEESALGTPAGAFWMFSIICVFALIFGLKMLPETKGRTLEEIAESWTKKG